MDPNVERPCRFCGIVIRGHDEIAVIGDDPVHVACGEASSSDGGVWEHTEVATLSQWSAGLGWVRPTR